MALEKQCSDMLGELYCSDLSGHWCHGSSKNNGRLVEQPNLGVNLSVLCNFYGCLIQSVLTFGFLSWSGRRSQCKKTRTC